MGRPCRVCKSGLAERFGELQKKSFSQRRLAKELGVSHWNVRSHLNHAGELSKEPSESSPVDLAALVRAQTGRLLKLIGDAAAREDYQSQIKAEAELNRALSLGARIGGLSTQPGGEPSTSHIRSLAGILAVELAPYPEIAKRVCAAVERFGAASGHAG